MTGDGSRVGRRAKRTHGMTTERVANASERILRATSIGVVRATRWPGQRLAEAQQHSIDKAITGSSVAMVYWPDPRSEKDQQKAAKRADKRAAKGKRPSRFRHGPQVGWHPGIKPLARVDFALDAVFAAVSVAIAILLHELITAALLTFLVYRHVKTKREAVKQAGSRQETPKQKERRERRRTEWWVSALLAVLFVAWYFVDTLSLRTVLIATMIAVAIYSLLANRLDMIVIRKDGYGVRVHGVFVRSTPRIHLPDARLLAPKSVTWTIWGRLTVDSASSEDGEFRGWGFTTYPEQFVGILQHIKKYGVPEPPTNGTQDQPAAQAPGTTQDERG